MTVSGRADAAGHVGDLHVAGHELLLAEQPADLAAGEVPAAARVGRRDAFDALGREAGHREAGCQDRGRGGRPLEAHDGLPCSTLLGRPARRAPVSTCRSGRSGPTSGAPILPHLGRTIHPPVAACVVRASPRAHLAGAGGVLGSGTTQGPIPAVGRAPGIGEAKMRYATGLSATLTALVLLAGPARGADQMTLQLNWFHLADHSPFYLAMERGYFDRGGHRARDRQGQRVGGFGQEDRPQERRGRYLRHAHGALGDQQGGGADDRRHGVRQGGQQRLLLQGCRHRDAAGPGRQERRGAARGLAPGALAGVRRGQRHGAGMRSPWSTSSPRASRASSRRATPMPPSTSTPRIRSGRRRSARAMSATFCGRSSASTSTATAISCIATWSPKTRS